MKEEFESKFSGIQSDMISVCLEYIENKGDKIYIYCSYENNCIACDFFYNINGLLYERHNLPCGYNADIEKQMKCMEILTNDVEKLMAVCSDSGIEMPTEIKIVYDIKLNKAAADYKYDLVYSNSGKFADTIVEEWFNEINANYDKG